MKARTFPGLGLACALLAPLGAVQAQTFSNLRVEPNPATAGQPVELVLSIAGCSPFVQPGVAGIAGSVVTVRVRYSDACGTPPPPSPNTRVPLGRFAEGSYTLRFISTAEGFGEDPPIDVAFLVNAGSGGPAPVAAPIGGWPVIAALGGLLAWFAGRRLRPRA